MARKKKSQNSLVSTTSTSTSATAAAAAVKGGEASECASAAISPVANQFSASPTSTPQHQHPQQTSTKNGNANAKNKPQEPSTPALIICRNKHWRYISSFHGPWLQLPPEVLESLAYSNYMCPRPQPIDPVVFFDLVKIRRLIEEATNLVVRAANGTTSSSLNNSLNASNGLMGGGSAAALGLGIGIGGGVGGGGGGGTAKLSRERRHRMREHATQKLSHAYHLDEIAASVATMQSASVLEEVAKLVLQRNEHDSDAKYVHFFHEKIPSRSLAQCTSLQPLDEVIESRPSEGAPFRTRAVTKTFKDDYVGAARDLTEGLGVYRLYTAQHKDRENQLELMDDVRRRNAQTRDSRHDIKIDEKDQPNSLEPQLLFHRGGVYLTIACQHIDGALDAWKIWQREQSSVSLNKDQSGEGNSPPSPTLSPAGKEAYRRWLEARKIVKTNAKRALRDYMSFLAHFDYTPGLPSEVAEEFLRKVNVAASGYTKPRRTRSPQHRLLDSPSSSHSADVGALAVNGSERSESCHHSPRAHGSHHSAPPTEIHPVSALFSAIPPPNLPPYPVETRGLVPSSKTSSHEPGMPADPDCHEAVTYHPLLTDALHSVLLAHSLIQTSSKELLRHAHMVTRLARVCDGYPIFLAARSPARADWIEVVRRTDNWIGLEDSWESLCAPAPLPGYQPTEKPGETEEQVKERRKHEAIMEALADDRVQDEESFRAAVKAQEKKAGEQRKQQESGSTNHGSPSNGSGPKRWAQEDGKEYPISTDRAELVARWIQEAPAVSGDGSGKAKRSGKRRVKKGGASVSAAASTAETSSVQLEDSFHELSVDVEHDHVG